MGVCVCVCVCVCVGWGGACGLCLERAHELVKRADSNLGAGHFRRLGHPGTIKTSLLIVLDRNLSQDW